MADLKERKRFFGKISLGHEGGCWLWTGCTTEKGYGKFRSGPRTVRAHRWSYEHLQAPIPESLELDHLCRVRSCVNPTHLEPVTGLENVRRGRAGAHERNKTECPQGHPYSEENTYRDRRDFRHCRTCLRDREIHRSN